MGSGMPVCSEPGRSVLQTSLQDFSSVQHSEQIGPAWKGHSATSGISNCSVHTLHCTCTVERSAGGTLGYGASKTWVQQEVATSCRLEERVIPGKYAMDDFNFETPSTDLIASVDSTVATDGAKRRIYEYPGGFLKKDKGEARRSHICAASLPHMVAQGRGLGSRLATITAGAPGSWPSLAAGSAQ